MNEPELNKPKFPRGWGCSPVSRKAHYFREGQVTSACGKIGFFFGEREDDNHDSPDNCAECKKKRARGPRGNAGKKGGGA